ncbi:MAG: peptide chain release factor 1 [Clostridia bacterium]|nr:peptide chain release factor 1 [Clostridia bacterium]
MIEKLKEIYDRFVEVSEKIASPELISNQDEMTKLYKEHSELTPLADKYLEYKKAEETVEEATMMLEDADDPEFKEMLEDELREAKEKLPVILDELKIMLLPKNPDDDKNVIVEIRGGAGGDEAALFGADLMRMYTRYAERNNWKTEMLSSNITDMGGVKEVSFSLQGKSAYSRLKFESGVHRVQRIPTTESGGRIHTSTVTVAVLPEVEEVEVEINPNDLRIDVFRAGGPGGQCVNTTDSAVRVTHLPTGLVVSCQDEKSQHKNKDKAMKILRSRLFDLMQAQQHDEIANQRKNQVGTGDRSERIRTYNFPQGRVTDHRIGLTLHKLDAVLDGDLDEVIDALVTEDQAQRLKSQEGK